MTPTPTPAEVTEVKLRHPETPVSAAANSGTDEHSNTMTMSSTTTTTTMTANGIKHYKNLEKNGKNGKNGTIKKKDRPPLNDLKRIENLTVYPNEYEQIYEPPEFSVKELRNAVPPHLFERSLLKSSLYTIANLAAIACMYYTATYIDIYLPVYLTYIAWPIYWWFQG